MLIETAALMVGLTMGLQPVDVNIGDRTYELDRSVGVEAAFVLPLHECLALTTGVEWTPGQEFSIEQGHHRRLVPIKVEDEWRLKVGLLITWGRSHTGCDGRPCP